MTKWFIKMEGFSIEPVEAETASKAKYKVYKMAQEAGYYRYGFKSFLVDVERIWKRDDLK